jgi:hypothetical protein
MGIPNRERFGKGSSGAGEPRGRIALPEETIKRRVFGVDHRVACSTCGQDTYLRRRSVHSAEGDAYETQSFACRACKSLTTRIVDSAGRLLT